MSQFSGRESFRDRKFGDKPASPVKRRFGRSLVAGDEEFFEFPVVYLNGVGETVSAGDHSPGPQVYMTARSSLILSFKLTI